MKIGGKEVKFAPSSQLIVFPREDTHIALRATAVINRKEFDKCCPFPKMPQKRVKGGKLVDNPDDPKHQISVDSYNKSFMDYMIIASLSAPGEKEGDNDLPIEWEKVVRGDRKTWHLWDQELEDSGFSDMERKRIYSAVAEVNALSEAKIDEARKSFLQLRLEGPEQSSFQEDEPSDTPSGELASDSESDPQIAQ